MTQHHSPPDETDRAPHGLRITDVDLRVHADPDESQILKAFATITLNDVFVVHDLRVIRTQKYFVSMPSCLGKNGRHRDIAHPIDSAFREYLEECVIDAYLAEVDAVPVHAGNGNAAASERLR